MKKNLIGLTTTLIVALSWTAGAQIAPNPYVHYDPSIVSSVTVLTNTPPDTNSNHIADAVYLAQVDDQSSNGYHMIEADLPGHAVGTYPGYEFTNGLFGIDLGTAPFNGTPMDLLSPAEQDGLLDMIVNPNGAFTAFFVVRLEETNWSNPGQNQTFLGNSPFPNNSPGIGLYFQPASVGHYLSLRLAGQNLSIGELELRLGETAVIALLYDDLTAYWRLEIANSATSDGIRDGIELNIPADVDLSSTTDDLALGGSPMWANFYADVTVGEVVMYDRLLNPTNDVDYAQTLDTLAAKWNTVAPAPPPAMDLTVNGAQLDIAWLGPSTVEHATDLVASNWTGTVDGGESPFQVDLATVSAPQGNWRLGTAQPLFNPSGPMIIQYDPTIAASIHFATSTGTDNTAFPSGTVYVASIDDQTGNGLHAIETGLDIQNKPWGYAAYPSTNLFTTAAAAVDCGGVSGGTPFQVLNASQSDFLLDFSGQAAGKGYTIFIALKVEGSSAGGFQSILSNGPFPNVSSFGIYRDGGGAVVHQVGAGAASVLTPIGAAPVGTETVIAAGYDDTTGDLFVANRNSAGSGADGLATGNTGTSGVDYTSGTLPLTLACSPVWKNFFQDATYGEVRIYDEYYAPTSATYSNILAELDTKWLTP